MVYEIEGIRNSQRFGLVDDLYINPTLGFANRAKYYCVIGTRTRSGTVPVTLLVIIARDDPFFEHFSGVSFPPKHQIGDAPVLFHMT